MDKASKALRRSGVRIRSIGSGHSDLQMVIAQLKDVRTTGKVSGFCFQNVLINYILKPIICYDKVLKIVLGNVITLLFDPLNKGIIQIFRPPCNSQRVF